MFDHASGFKIDRSRFNQVHNGNMYRSEDRSRTSMVNSGNSYNNRYNNSFNDNSRRQHTSHHNTTHHHAGNVNLGDNYAHRPHGRAEPPRGYPSQDPRAYPHDRPRIPSPRGDARGAPHPPNDGINRSYTVPQANWGSKNPYLNPGDRAGGRQSPLQPHPPRGAPADHYDRVPPQARAGYDQEDDLYRERSPFDKSQVYPPPMARQSGYGHGVPYTQPPAHPPQRPAHRPPMNGPIFSEPTDYRGDHQGPPRSADDYSRTPSPGYDSSDREDRRHDGADRARRMRPTGNRGNLPPSFDRAMENIEQDHWEDTHFVSVLSYAYDLT
ncbi:hypothetical protein BKA70DRAFT_1269021 [Coprinopsis sp. MPI-PUGE-AT-0042]|nr:hypothetical protein BKA70DRAFT_1269021 [Coprinopsis sp. MPI-PUGE-AT-0042]